MSSSVVLVGGGLANCLIALRLKAARPDIRLTLLEGAGRLGGNHTWSFHGTDVNAATLAWLQPLASHGWRHYDVRFPSRERRLDGDYYSLTSERLHDMVSAALQAGVRLNSTVTDVAADRVTLAGGEVLTADLVIDGRGLQGSSQPGMTLRFQKFFGQHLRFAAPHELTGPLLMDATVSQAEGYRFVYVLPFTTTEVLIEDTYYSDSAAFDDAELRQNIARYAAERGWLVQELVREETGVLPIVLDGNPDAFWPAADTVPRSGLRAGLFHHTTGYSVPEAAALAHELASQNCLESASIAIWIRSRVQRRWREQWIFRLLNRLLFLAAAPAERYRVLEHFYRLPEPVIERFYAGRLTGRDALRILSGTPPVPVIRALPCLLPSSSHR
ncbi:MAG: lycopene beta-cyclase CrtY [Gammaproteobacteria bacterium]|nr:lycopene beta-cyclase CrtY [Gammaproteobacteria bacterium]